jgi:hypothetical protein
METSQKVVKVLEVIQRLNQYCQNLLQNETKTSYRISRPRKCFANLFVRLFFLFLVDC